MKGKMQFSDMKILDMRVFVYLAKGHTQAQASKEFGITQAGITYVVRRFEKQFPSPLFRRAGRRREMTPEGKEVEGFFREIISRFDAFTKTGDAS